MDDETIIRLRRVILRLARQLNAASVGEGLTPTQASVLGIVTHRGPLGLTELTEIEGLNPTMLSRVVGKLDSFGLIRRLRDPDDFRAARVEVTAEGRQAYQRIAAQRAAILSERVADMPPEQADALVVALPALEHLAEDLRAAVAAAAASRPARHNEASSLHSSAAARVPEASGLTIRMLLRACRHSSRLALSSISAGRPPWEGAPITIVLAPMALAYSATIRPATPWPGACRRTWPRAGTWWAASRSSCFLTPSGRPPGLPRPPRFHPR